MLDEGQQGVGGALPFLFGIILLSWRCCSLRSGPLSLLLSPHELLKLVLELAHREAREVLLLELLPAALVAGVRPQQLHLGLRPAVLWVLLRNCERVLVGTLGLIIKSSTVIFKVVAGVFHIRIPFVSYLSAFKRRLESGKSLGR